MQTLTVRVGEAIEDGNYPPRLVLADIGRGVVTILRVDNPEEDIDTLNRSIPHVQRMNKARSRKNG